MLNIKSQIYLAAIFVLVELDCVFQYVHLNYWVWYTDVPTHVVTGPQYLILHYGILAAILSMAYLLGLNERSTPRNSPESDTESTGLESEKEGN